jgi:hypothetical protein
MSNSTRRGGGIKGRAPREMVLAPFHSLLVEWFALIFQLVHFQCPEPSRHLCDGTLYSPGPTKQPAKQAGKLESRLPGDRPIGCQCPANIGLRGLCATVAKRTALPCFRRRISSRGKYRSRAFRTALGPSAPNMALTFTAFLATHLRTSSEAAQLAA